MPSIRKTKKRLKREIAELNLDFKFVQGRLYLADATYQHIKLIEKELQQLKKKKRK